MKFPNKRFGRFVSKGYFFGDDFISGSVLLNEKGASIWDSVKEHENQCDYSTLFALFTLVRKLEEMDVAVVSIRGNLHWINRIAGRWGYEGLPQDQVDLCETILDILDRRGWKLIAIPDEKNHAKTLVDNAKATKNRTLKKGSIYSVAS